jgi:hypothetical protein
MVTRRHTTSKPEPTPLPVEKASAGNTPARARKSATPTAPPRSEISEDVRRRMIAQAAYLRAEERGFVGGNETDDWFAAEAEVDALLRAKSGGTAQ